MTGHTCPTCSAPVANPIAAPCHACTTPQPRVLCRYCGIRLTLPADHNCHAHLECLLHHLDPRRPA